MTATVTSMIVRSVLSNEVEQTQTAGSE